MGKKIRPTGNAKQQDYQLKCRFHVVVDNVVNGSFQEAGPLKWTTAVEKIREGGNNMGEVHLVGPATFDKLTLKRGFLVANTEFFCWMKDMHDQGVSGKNKTRRHFSVEVHDDDGSLVGKYDFHNALVTNYSVDAFNAKAGEIALESVELTYDYFTVEAS